VSCWYKNSGWNGSKKKGKTVRNRDGGPPCDPRKELNCLAKRRAEVVGVFSKREQGKGERNGLRKPATWGGINKGGGTTNNKKDGTGSATENS